MGLGWGKASPAHANGKPFQAPGELVPRRKAQRRGAGTGLELLGEWILPLHLRGRVSQLRNYRHREVSPPDTHEGARGAAAAPAVRARRKPAGKGLCPTRAHPCLPPRQSPAGREPVPSSRRCRRAPRPADGTAKQGAFSIGSSDFPLPGPAARAPGQRCCRAQTSSGGCGGRAGGMEGGGTEGDGTWVLPCTNSLPWLESPAAHLGRHRSGEHRAAGAGQPPE